MYNIEFLPSADHEGANCGCCETVEQAVPDKWNFNYFDSMFFDGRSPFIIRAESSYPMAVSFLEKHTVEDSLVQCNGGGQMRNIHQSPQND
jgi:hypothetical protein